ncbi:MAG: ATP-binding protein [Candidatus Bathyarchaeia archaeon]
MIVTIMNLHFVDRQGELQALNELFAKKRAALVLVYGRRRVGKTRLIQEFIRDKGGLYFYVPNAEEKTILDEFSRVAETDFFKGFRFSDFPSFMEYLAKKCSENGIIVFDEFQRLTRIDGAISMLQKYWDEKLAKTECFLVLSSSSIGAVRRVAFSGDAPLYGRRTAALKIEPLKFLDLFEWFKGFSAEELVAIYGSFGGTPAYLEHVDESLSVEENIVEKILCKRSPLHDEPEMLLLEEIRAPQRYVDILSAIARGKNTISEIADATGLSRENTTTYLKTLETLDLVERVTPVNEPEARRGLYKIRDPFFNFWFSFVRPNKRQLEMELEKNVWQSIKGEFKMHLGRIFEDICTEVLVEMARRNMLPLKIAKIGKWWWKETEIDIVGVENKGKKAIAIEAKLASLDYQEAKKLLSQLTVKAGQIRGVEDCLIGIMAKEIEDKEKIQSEGFIAIDLNDMANLCRQED